MAEDDAPLLASEPGSPRTSNNWERIEIGRPKKRKWRRGTLCSRRRLCVLALIALVCLALLATLYHGLAVDPSSAKAADLRWISTSSSSLDRFACRWFGICGLANWWHYEEPSALGRPEELEHIPPDLSSAWIDPRVGQHPEDLWSAEEHAKREIPNYVWDYAPYVFLYDEERYWPSDPAEHLAHSCVARGEEEQELIPVNLTLSSLGELNEIPDSRNGRDIYLVSLEDPDSRPEWMLSRWNRPSYHHSPQSKLGQSRAPAILICVPRLEGILDAFFFFFYSYNEGNMVLGTRYGNHVGDWEHTMLRYRHGKPEEIYLSRHSWGSAYNYEAIEKIGKRPVVFAGNGSHANYPRPGSQPYVLPFGMLKDETGRGHRWDPILNIYAYTYEPDEIKREATREDDGLGTFRAATINPRAPTSWLEFAGHWGDARYPLGDRRQYRFFGETHFASGPTGPMDKQLAREDVCDNKNCVRD